MLKKTFCHTTGISENTEKKLWANDINSWEDFLNNYENIDCLTPSQLNKIKTELLFSIENLEQENILYFKDKLPNKQHYRLANYGKVAYVDIETTGLSKYTDDITMIGIYDGETPHVFINDKNSLKNEDSIIANYGNLEDAKELLKQFDIIVTFNGKTFDLPFIEYKFKEKYEIVHLDLRFMLKELGLAGGLKNIEKSLGIQRDDEIAQVDGFEAVRLWRRYIRGDEEALKKLIKYNIEDIVNLKDLLEYYLENRE